MATCKKEVEIEFGDDSNGELKTIDVTVIVEGFLEVGYGADADGNRGADPGWLVESWSDSEFDKDGLTEKEILEINEKIEEIALSNSWDFDSAKDDEEADEFVERDED